MRAAHVGVQKAERNEAQKYDGEAIHQDCAFTLVSMK